jgi:sarcosine oxidase subunit beta
MAERHDVVVIGGGIMGATALFELARRGVDALLLEAEPAFGGRDSSKTAGIIRTHYSNPEVVRMAIRGRAIFRDFPETTGRPPVFHETGYIFLSAPDTLERSRANVEMQREQGATVEELGPERLPDFAPGMNADGLAAIFHEPGSGYVDPVPAADGFVAAAVAAGASARSGVRVRRLLTDAGRIVGVETEDGPVHCRDVVLAAGAGSQAIAATAALNLPITYSIEEELLVLGRADDSPHVPISNSIDAVYLRPELSRHVPDGGRAVLLGRGFPKDYPIGDPSDYPAQVGRPELTEDLLRHVALRNPTLATAPVLQTKVALYDITPDWHPLLGRVDETPGLWLITGGSGHGFKLAPAFAEMVAAEYCGEPVEYASVAHFSLDRFARGETFGSAYGGNRA